MEQFVIFAIGIFNKLYENLSLLISLATWLDLDSPSMLIHTLMGMSGRAFPYQINYVGDSTWTRSRKKKEGIRMGTLAFFCEIRPL